LVRAPEDFDHLRIWILAVIRTSRKIGNRAFSVAGPRENGAAFLLQFVNAHLLPNLSQN